MAARIGFFLTNLPAEKETTAAIARTSEISSRAARHGAGASARSKPAIANDPAKDELGGVRRGRPRFGPSRRLALPDCRSRSVVARLLSQYRPPFRGPPLCPYFLRRYLGGSQPLRGQARQPVALRRTRFAAARSH